MSKINTYYEVYAYGCESDVYTAYTLEEAIEEAKKWAIELAKEKRDIPVEIRIDKIDCQTIKAFDSNGCEAPIW